VEVLYLDGNEGVKIQNYRKRFVYELKKLKFLDDRPVTEDERIIAEV